MVSVADTFCPYPAKVFPPLPSLPGDHTLVSFTAGFSYRETKMEEE